MAEESANRNFDAIERYLTTAMVTLSIMGTLIFVGVLWARSAIIAAFHITGADANLIEWMLPYVGLLSIYIFVVEALNATLSGWGMDLSNYTRLAAQSIALVTSVSFSKKTGVLRLFL